MLILSSGLCTVRVSVGVEYRVLEGLLLARLNNYIPCALGLLLKLQNNMLPHPCML